MNIAVIIVSALLALCAAANSGLPHSRSATSAVGAASIPVPTPSPTPVPPQYDVLGGGGPSH